MYIKKQLSLSLIALIFLSVGLSAQKKDAKKDEKEKPPKTMEEMVATATFSDDGLFKVYKIEGKYHFGISKKTLKKSLLLVSRIAQIPDDLNPYLNAGSKVGEQVVYWEKSDEYLQLRIQSFQNVADEKDPISTSVNINNFEPIIERFKIKAYDGDSSVFLIEVDALFSDDVKALSAFSAERRKDLNISSLDKGRSYIERISAYPKNVEVRHISTFNMSKNNLNKAESASLLMAQSFLLLPESPMQTRYYDYRVGWIHFTQNNYSSDALKTDTKKFIRRWRLEPKDRRAYSQGQLVEPIKPIVWYIDAATPEKWRKYFKQGIEDWNQCFEKAGFKNAIQAKMAPTPEEDPEFSPEDARYSVVRYVASTTRNAIGPSVADPRTGEILESDIIWYHNHLRSYRNRYLLETGAANPNARTLNTPEEEIGEMMRRVISHEVGHALGLPHNMKASSAYPTDSLRSVAFTQKYGIATTIMDYARYNYVAQPGDGDVRFVRQLGPYDDYAINYGYRYYPENAEDEIPILKAFVDAKNKDPLYQFGWGYGGEDPDSQTECIGANNVTASEYGLDNLEIVSKNLIEWTNTPNENYDDLEELYNEMLSVYYRYINHVVNNVGGIRIDLKNNNEAGEIYMPLSAEEQLEALHFIKHRLFETQKWLLNKSIADKISAEALQNKLAQRQEALLRNLLNAKRLVRVQNQYELNDSLLSMYDVLKNIQEAIFADVYFSDESNVNLRLLQKAFVAHAIHIATDDENYTKSDATAIMRKLLKDLSKKLSRAGDDYIEEAHFEYLVDSIEEALFDD